MEYPERKLNRLTEYDYSATGAYFVTLYTQNRKKILSSIVGDGFPVPVAHKNPILNRKIDRILSRKMAKKDAVCIIQL